MSKPKINKTTLKNAIKGSYGNISNIAKKLNCERKTVYEKIEKFEFQDLINDEREQILDLAENKLIDRLNTGSEAMIALVLKTLGKDRGYSEKHSVDNTFINYDLSKVPIQYLERIVAGEDFKRVIADYEKSIKSE